MRTRQVPNWAPRLLAGLCAAAMLLSGAEDARAAVIWQEDFESASGLSDGKWASWLNAAVTTPGYNSSKCVTFTAQHSSGDLVSNGIAVTGSTNYWITVDFKERGAGGWLQVKGYNGGGQLKQTILVFGDSLSGALTTLNSGSASFYRYTRQITTIAPVASLVLRLQDWDANSTPAGHVFFDNIQVSNAPPQTSTTATKVRWNEVTN